MSLCCVDVGVSADGRKVLAQVSLDILPGRFTAILGPNGAGKSTLLSVLTGQRQPLGGQLLLDGKPLGQTPAATLAQRRAVMLQESAVAFDFLAREVVELGRFPHRKTPPRKKTLSWCRPCRQPMWATWHSATSTPCRVEKKHVCNWPARWPRSGSPARTAQTVGCFWTSRRQRSTWPTSTR